jgi:hypothetical protein
MRLLVLMTAALALIFAPASAATKKSAKEFAPGQMEKKPGQAKRLAPGQKQNQPGQAKKFAPGQKAH